MCGIKTDRSLRIIAAGHAFFQNLRRGHYELATDATARDRVAVAFTELAPPSDQPGQVSRFRPSPFDQRNSAARTDRVFVIRYSWSTSSVRRSATASSLWTFSTL